MNQICLLRWKKAEAEGKIRYISKTQWYFLIKVYVIGLEDIILDRMRACVHWKSNSDCEWAQRLFFLHKQNLDMEYLRNTAKKDKTFELLKEILKRITHHRLFIIYHDNDMRQ